MNYNHHHYSKVRDDYSAVQLGKEPGMIYVYTHCYLHVHVHNDMVEHVYMHVHVLSLQSTLHVMEVD